MYVYFSGSVLSCLNIVGRECHPEPYLISLPTVSAISHSNLPLPKSVIYFQKWKFSDPTTWREWSVKRVVSPVLYRLVSRVIWFQVFGYNGGTMTVVSPSLLLGSSSLIPVGTSSSSHWNLSPSRKKLRLETVNLLYFRTHSLNYKDSDKRCKGDFTLRKSFPFPFPFFTRA